MQTLTIPAASAVSNATRVNRDQRLFSMFVRGGWDAADVQFEIADEPDAADADFLPVCKDDTGAPAYLVPFAVDKRVCLDLTAMSLASVEGYVRVRSVTVGGGADVAQAAERVINLDLK